MVPRPFEDEIMSKANTVLMFSLVNDAAYLSNMTQEGNTLTATFTNKLNRVIIISLKTVSKGFYSLAYHWITDTNETSQDYSAPFPESMAREIIAAVVNDGLFTA